MTRRDIPTLVAGLVAIGALVVAVLAIHNAQQDASRLHALQGRVQTVANANSANETQAAQLVTIENELHKLGPQFQAIKNCLPELQTEIGALKIQWKIAPFNASEDSFEIRDTQQISRVCEQTLYGTGEHPPLG